MPPSSELCRRRRRLLSSSTAVRTGRLRGVRPPTRFNEQEDVVFNRLLSGVDSPSARLSQRTDKKINAEEEVTENRERCDGFSCFAQEAFSK